MSSAEENRKSAFKQQVAGTPPQEPSQKSARVGSPFVGPAGGDADMSAESFDIEHFSSMPQFPGVSPAHPPLPEETDPSSSDSKKTPKDPMANVTKMFEEMMTSMKGVKQSVSDVKAEVSQMHADMITRKEFDSFKAEVDARFVSLSDSSSHDPGYQTLKVVVERQARALDKLDVAHGSVCLSGFSLETNIAARLTAVENFMAEHFADVRTFQVDSIFSGPVGARRITAKTLVAFGNKQVRDDFLKQVSSKQLILTVAGNEISFGKAKTQKQIQRNSSMMQALDKIKAHSDAANKTCKIEWKLEGTWDRSITVAGQTAFIQKAGENIGNFLGSFSNMTL